MSYRKRQEKRERRIQKRINNRKNFENQNRFQFKNMLNTDPYIWAYLELESRIGKKFGCQFYREQLGKNVTDTFNTISADKIITEYYHEFITLEHGKRRKVQAPCFGEKVVQKVLCSILKPLLSHYFIKNNKASLAGGGIDFARKAVIQHLADYYRHYGPFGWVVTTDIHHYYDSHDHKVLKSLLENYITKKDFLSICYQYLSLQIDKETGENKGVGIGTEDSQIYSLLYSNPVDHLVTNQLHCKYYSRYMDDSYVICPTYKKALEVYNKVIAKYHELGLKLNMNKTKITRLENGFNFLKTRYLLKANGKIIRCGGKESARRARKRLRIFPMVEKMGIKDRKTLMDEYKSWQNAMIKYFNCNKFIMETDRLSRKTAKEMFQNEKQRLQATN